MLFKGKAGIDDACGHIYYAGAQLARLKIMRHFAL
jgi:hypothetical protein